MEQSSSIFRERKHQVIEALQILHGKTGHKATFNSPAQELALSGYGMFGSRC